MSDPRDIQLGGYGYGRGLSYDERKELEEKATTENILNLAAQKSGVLRKTEHLDLHGEDATRREVHEGMKPFADPLHTTEEITRGATHTAFDMAEVIEPVEHALGVVTTETLGLAGAAIAMYETADTLPRAWEAGDREAEARVQDAMHLAVIGSVQGLPAAFVNEQVEHRKEAVQGSGAEAYKIGAFLQNNPKLRAVLQLRCDEGMKSAEAAILSGEGVSRFFERNAGLHARYEKDAAFKAGFDAVVFAHAHGNAEYTKTITDLHQRDARYSATNFTWQG